MESLLRAQTMKILVALLILTFSRASVWGGENIGSLCEIHYPSDNRIDWDCVELQGGDSPYALFGKHWQDVLRFNRIDRLHFHEGEYIKVPRRLAEIDHFTPLPSTYPDAADVAKFILVDQAEMFLGAYEHGKLVFSTPVSLGMEGHRVPKGDFTIDAVDLSHQSNVYFVEGTGRPYPMHYGMRFFVEKKTETWPSYWIHGRDMPGYPASHGCIGLYDEEMQKEYYGKPDKPLLMDARKLYEWVVGRQPDSGTYHTISNGPAVRVVGSPPF